MMDVNAPILVLGAGTFGLSTAYHLARGGYRNVTVLEKSTAIPPELSAGNDLNKIVRAEYEDPFYTDLALQAIEAWKQQPFEPFYREVGYLLCVSDNAPDKARRTLRMSRESVAKHPAWRGMIEGVDQRQDIRRIAPAFDGPMEWTGYFNRHAGYARAAAAMKMLYDECVRLGVTFRLGDAVERLNYSDDGRTCVGATTTGGQAYTAEKTVVSLGASVVSVLPDLTKQIQAIGFPVAHVQLSPEEAARLRGIPVTYARDIGFFFEPDAQTQLLKLCNSGSSYTNLVANGVDKEHVSIAPGIPEDTNFISSADETALRRLLQDTLPLLADRPLIQQSICWCADSTDTNFLIDNVPASPGLIVASGDSGHGFKMLPIVGLWVKDVLERGEQRAERWRWKDVQDAEGEGDVSWRVAVKKDVKDVRPASARL